MNKIIDTCPLNNMQERLFKASPGIPMIDSLTHTHVKIKGKIDIERFEKTIAAIVARHEALRTIIDKDETGTYVNKVIDEWEEVKLNVVKLSDGTTEEKEAELIRIGNETGYRIGRRDGTNDWKQPFDFTLFDFGNDEYVFLISIIHLVTDGVSNNIIIGEIVSLYNGMELPPVKKGFMAALREYSELTESEEGQKIIKEWEEKVKNYDESFITFAKDGHNRRESFSTLTLLPLGEMSAFTKKNKMGNADLTMFLCHLAISSVFGTDFTMIGSANSNRSISTRSTVGYLVSSDVTMLEYDEKKTIAELLNDFRERNKANERTPLTACFSFNTSFLFSYLNYYGKESKKMMFGKDATVEPYPNFVYKKLWNNFIVIGIEAGDQLIIRYGTDPEVFTPEILEKFKSYLHAGLKCLTEESSISFREFRAMN